MQPWMLIDTAPVPGGTEHLRLMRRGTEFAINLGSGLLMGSRMRGSEEELARLGCAALKARGSGGRVLVGGLGMGFTLRAALDALGPAASVEVAEIVPAIVDWVRGPLAYLSGDAMADGRVTLRLGDVARTIRTARDPYDVILLDVDNGPAGLTRAGNNSLYDAAGLRAAWRALTPAGVLAVWSAVPDRAFDQRLAKMGFAVAAHAVRAHGGKGSSHHIWVATRPSGPGRAAPNL